MLVIGETRGGYMGTLQNLCNFSVSMQVLLNKIYFLKECPLHARLSAGCFSLISYFNSHNNRWEYWVSKKLRDLPKVTQLRNLRTRIQTWEDLPPNPVIIWWHFIVTLGQEVFSLRSLSGRRSQQMSSCKMGMGGVSLAQVFKDFVFLSIILVLLGFLTY